MPETAIRVDKGTKAEEHQPAAAMPEKVVAAITDEASPSPTPAAETKPTDPENSVPKPAPTMHLHRIGGISIKNGVAAPALPKTEEVPADPVTQEQLEQYWQELLAAMAKDYPKQADILKNGNPKLDGTDHFVITVDSSYQEAEIKPFLTRMLTYLRAKSHRPLLNCEIAIVIIEKKSIIYTPRDKYDAMSTKNHALETFKILFPEVDY